MKLLINLATLKSGGGQNVGLNFISVLHSNDYDLRDFVFAVAKNSELEDYLSKTGNMNYFTVSQNPIKRIIFEIFKGRYVIKKYDIDMIYSIFGIGLYPKWIKQVSGSADSNLFFPEIDFWEGYGRFDKVKKDIIDRFRIFALKRSSGVIFENKVMLERSKFLFKLQNTIYIKPSINTNWDNSELEIQSIKSCPVGLFFCGWQKNKNYILIPQIAAELKKRKIDFHFVITARIDNSKEFLIFNNLLKDYDVTEMVTITGQIKKSEIFSLYQQIDFVFLLSKLESFSNNIIESWYFKKPLIISDELWAHSICKEAGIYVNRNDVKSITNAIQALLYDKNKYDMAIKNGLREYSSYPTDSEKVDQELKFIKQIYESN
jgi:glycosyltransferase involved in cell wall biosynthesis